MAEDVLSKLKGKFDFFIDATLTTNTIICLRSTIKTEEDAKKFVKSYSAAENSIFKNVFTFGTKTCNYEAKWDCHHSRGFKRGISSDTLGCGATICLKITKKEEFLIKTENFSKAAISYPCTITIFPHHNHTMCNPEDLRKLEMSDEVEEKFFQYFIDDISFNGARLLNGAELLLNNSSEVLGNTSLHPSEQQLQKLYKRWKKDQNFDSIQRIVDKIPLFEQKGTTIRVWQQKPWAVIVQTGVMKRARSYALLRGVLFVSESISNPNYYITLVLTATKAGAVPIAVLIHEYQTRLCYHNAFSLFKSMCPSFFGEREKAMTIFVTKITNNSEVTSHSEIQMAVLRSIWPSAHLLLCQFHVAQSEWKMRTGKKSLSRECRYRLMKTFLAALYAKSKKQLDDSIEALFKEKKYVISLKSFKQFLVDRQSEWSTLYRLNLPNQNSGTNNYAETTVRVLQQTISKFSKKLNVVGFVEFCSILDEYLIKWLKVYTEDTQNRPMIFYDSLHSGVFEDLVIFKQTEEETCLESNYVYALEGETWTVNSAKGKCTCFAGKKGGFCEHQYYVYKLCRRVSPNLPLLSDNERCRLAKMALGEYWPPVNSFIKTEIE